jgi:hypothetical protein
LPDTLGTDFVIFGGLLGSKWRRRKVDTAGGVSGGSTTDSQGTKQRYLKLLRRDGIKFHAKRYRNKNMGDTMEEQR